MERGLSRTMNSLRRKPLVGEASWGETQEEWAGFWTGNICRTPPEDAGLTLAPANEPIKKAGWKCTEEDSLSLISKLRLDLQTGTGVCWLGASPCWQLSKRVLKSRPLTELEELIKPLIPWSCETFQQACAWCRWQESIYRSEMIPVERKIQGIHSECLWISARRNVTM